MQQKSKSGFKVPGYCGKAIESEKDTGKLAWVIRL